MQVADGDVRLLQRGPGGPFSNTEAGLVAHGGEPCTLPKPGDATALKRALVVFRCFRDVDGFRVGDALGW
jgi:hypothetical protein